MLEGVIRELARTVISAGSRRFLGGSGQREIMAKREAGKGESARCGSAGAEAEFW